MADYSFSSAAMRRKKPNIKTKMGDGEDTDAKESAPLGPAHSTVKSAAPSAPGSPLSSSRRQSKEESKEPLSLSARSSASGGSKVQNYIANLNKSKGPTPAVSEGSSDNSKGWKKSAPTSNGGSSKDNWLQKGTKEEKMTRETSMSSSSGSSDDSELGSKTIDKYRKKYLDGEKTNGKGSKGTNLKTSSFESTGDDSNKDTYNKYRKQLTENKDSGDKWAAPKKKIGAPPPLEYNYRYSSAPNASNAKEKPKPVVPTPETKPKMEKVKLKSNKIAKDDLGILASMLGADDSDSESEASRGIFSASSEDEGPYMDGQSSVDDDPVLSEKSDRQDQDKVEHSEAFEEVSVKSESSYEEEVVDEVEEEIVEDEVVDEVEEELIEEVIEESPAQKPKPSLSSRLAKLHSLKKANELDKGGSNSIQPNIREDQVEEEGLGNFLDNRINTNKLGKDKSERSGSSGLDGDDFSALWAQSVDSQSRRNTTERDEDSTSSAELSKEIHDAPSPLALGASKSGIPDDQSLESSDSTLEASGNIESSFRLDVSELSGDDVFPKTTAAPKATKAQKPVESSSDSDSEGSLDFDKLTGLEQYTMQDSKNSSGKQFETQTPVMSNKKTPNGKAPPKELKRGPDGNNEKLLAVAREEESDGSLDAFDLGGKPPKQPEKKTDSRGGGGGDDDDGSMSDFSLNPAKDLMDDKSLSEFDKPEYQPQRLSESIDLNSAFVGLDAGSLADIENPYVKKSQNSKSASEKSSIVPAAQTVFIPPRKSMYPTGYVRHIGKAWVALAVLAAIGLPIYFFLFHGDNIVDETPPLDLFPTPPTFAPTAAPVASPTLVPIPTEQPFSSAPVPTRRPTPPPTTVAPTVSPTRSRISLLREFLISVWPSLEDDFVGFRTPQYFALEWLANNANYEDYSDDQLVQRFALATFYFSTSGERWRNNTLWLSDEDECSWYSSGSVSPCNQDGFYTSLDLDLNDLSGTIPAELGLLSNLSQLDLSKAGSAVSLSSTIPSEIGLLVNLGSLSFRGNDLNGTIPSEIGNLVNLQSLDLSTNKISGVIPESVGSLGGLQLLDLSRNDFTGQLPLTFGQLVKLEQLQLAENSISGAIPTGMGQMSLLERVNLDDNQFSSLPTEIGNLVLLQRFSAANNLIRGVLPSQIGNLMLLVSLRLNDNSLTGTIPSELGNLIELRDELDLSGNQLSGPLPATLSQLVFLRNMLLYDNLLTGSVPDAFSALRRLGVLRLESNSLTGVVGDPVCAVFNTTYPVFVADCAAPAEIECSCCMYCCVDMGDCFCEYANTDLDFLCAGFKRSPGLEERVVDA